ncbi:hypothetical protein ES332_D11G340500v1 [Gossypium tomentosum]|uniref:Uncharacterized protein n=1 Tax=Gossypium tomentosum TaxID=34277 RepID=A0A5D2IVP8_GOSTO|nr:hypothetical protein ES332_D11G340500v1 [Gossypium tomentosum]
MSPQISANMVPTQDNKMSKENCHLANFNPTFWGDIFLYSPVEMTMDAKSKLQYEELKQEVRRMLKEIEDALQIIYHHHCNQVQTDNDLYTTTVRFLLLREHGFDVHCDEKGKFKESLINDVKGILELYEAAHFQLHGENILEEALSFIVFHLKLKETTIDYPLSTQIANALKPPLHKSLPRLVAWSYISLYEGYGKQDENLLKFAKLDFKMVQHNHKKEINELTKWWTGFDVPTNFPFARDRMAECYLWILGVYFEPHYSIARTFMTKVISLTSVLDDIYDAYGTQEELELLTKAIQRWDIKCIDQLPEYMKLCYREVLNMKQQCQAYYVEFKWLHENYMPTLDEYLSVALVTSCYQLLTIVSFVGMEDSITKQTFIWAFNDPKILRALTIICRLMDDVVSHQFEQERGHVPSAVECYMKQYGASKQEAYDELYKQIKNAWKDINEGFLKPRQVPISALNRILNLTRVLDLFYKDHDGSTNVGDSIKASITTLLIDPISV